MPTSDGSLVLTEQGSKTKKPVLNAGPAFHILS